MKKNIGYMRRLIVAILFVTLGLAKISANETENFQIDGFNYKIIGSNEVAVCGGTDYSIEIRERPGS